MLIEVARFYVELADGLAAKQAFDYAHELISDRIGWETIIRVQRNGNPCCLEVLVWHPNAHTPRHLVIELNAQKVTRSFRLLWDRGWTFESLRQPLLGWSPRDETDDSVVYCRFCGHYTSLVAAMFRGDHSCLNPDCGRRLCFETRHRLFLADYLARHGAKDKRILYTEVGEPAQAARLVKKGLPDPRVENVAPNTHNPSCVELATHWPRIETLAAELADSDPAIMRITHDFNQIYLRN